MLKSLLIFKEFANRTKPGSQISIHDYLSSSTYENQEHIISYMESGIYLDGFLQHVDDIINPNNKNIAPDNYWIDGEWVWSEDLIYYVRKYNLILPKGFVHTAKASNWVVAKKDFDLEELSKQFKFENWYGTEHNPL